MHTVSRDRRDSSHPPKVFPEEIPDSQPDQDPGSFNTGSVVEVDQATFVIEGGSQITEKKYVSVASAFVNILLLPLTHVLFFLPCPV